MKSSITCVALAAVFGLVAISPADASSKKQSKSATQSATSSAASVAKQSAQAASGNSHSAHGRQLDQKPGPAHRTVSGVVKQVNGPVYVMEDYEGKEVRMFVSNQTKKLRGDKKPGDSIRAELTYGGHANSVQ
jgi:hypothetical protein